MFIGVCNNNEVKKVLSYTNNRLFSIESVFVLNILTKTDVTNVIHEGINDYYISMDEKE